MTYELFCRSVRGASHIRKDIPCQDSGMKKDCGEYKIFAAADGHGDFRCIRSDTGSQKICEIACEDLETFAGTLGEQEWESKLFQKSEAELLVRQLCDCMVGKWIEAVGEEYERNPLTEAEKQRTPGSAGQYEAGSRVERMYGTTLIAGLQTEKYLLLLQQGDGRCVVFHDDGRADQPIPWDERCVGNATTSLCDDDAAPSFRFHVIDLEKDPVIACIAGTDGVEDSFPASMEKTHAYYRRLLQYACEKGVPALEEYLAEELRGLSANGSADDVTVSGIMDVERVRPFLGVFEESNRLVEMEHRVAALESKLNSILYGGRLQHLEQVYEQAKLREQETSRKCKEASEQYHSAECQCREAEDKEKNKRKSCENKQREYQKIKKQFETKASEYEEAIKQKNEAYKRCPTEMSFVKNRDELKMWRNKCENLKKEKDDLGKEKCRKEGRQRNAEKIWQAALTETRSKEAGRKLAEERWKSAQKERSKAVKEKKDAEMRFWDYQEKCNAIRQERDEAQKELENSRK